MHRFKLQKAVAECAAILIVGGFATFAGAALAEANRASIARVAGAGVAAVATIIAAMALLRWRQVIFVTDSGVTYARGTGGAVVVPWAQIREVNEGGASGLRMIIGTADGHRVRITDDYENAAELMTIVRRRGGEAVVASLEREWLDEGRMTFRHPGARLIAHVEYFVATSCVGVAGAVGWSALRKSDFLFGTIFVCTLLGAIVLAVVELMRRDARWRGASVTLTPAGLCVSRLDGTAQVAWAEVTGAEYVGWELVVRREAGAPLPVPLTIANAGYLQHYVGQLSRRGG